MSKYKRVEVTLEDGRVVSRERKWQLDHPEIEKAHQARKNAKDITKIRKAKWWQENKHRFNKKKDDA